MIPLLIKFHTSNDNNKKKNLLTQINNYDNSSNSRVNILSNNAYITKISKKTYNYQ